jgi:hypothetical protein
MNLEDLAALPVLFLLSLFNLWANWGFRVGTSLLLLGFSAMDCHLVDGRLPLGVDA